MEAKRINKLYNFLIKNNFIFTEEEYNNMNGAEIYSIGNDFIFGGREMQLENGIKYKIVFIDNNKEDKLYIRKKIKILSRFVEKEKEPLISMVDPENTKAIKLNKIFFKYTGNLILDNKKYCLFTNDKYFYEIFKNIMGAK